MTITVQGSDYREVLQKLGRNYRTSEIMIRWRSINGEELGGCIVDATLIKGEEVAKHFATYVQALAYIEKILKARDDSAKNTAKKKKGK